MKFRILLWFLARLMAKASRNNPDFRQQLEGKDLTFQLHTFDNKISRCFVIKNQRIESHSGTCPDPVFSIGFKDAAYGYATMTAKKAQLAFMQGIQDKDIRIAGDTSQVIWFQGLIKYLKPKKPKA